MKKYFPKWNDKKIPEITAGWYQSFKGRNDINTRVPSTMENDRNNCATTGTISAWWDSIYSKHPHTE